MTKIVTPARIKAEVDNCLERWVKQGLNEEWHTKYNNIIGNQLNTEIGKQVAERLTISIKVD